MVPVDIFWTIFLAFARTYFRASHPTGPLASIACVNKQWNAIAGDSYLLNVSETIPQVALWKLARLDSISLEKNHRLLATVQKSVERDERLFLDLFKKVSDIESLKFLYAHLPQRTFKRKKTYLLDTNLQHLVKVHNLKFKGFLESHRPNQSAALLIQNQFSQPSRPFRIENANGLYHGFRSYLEPHLHSLWSKAHRKSQYETCGFYSFTNNVIFPMQIFVLEEFFGIRLLSDYFIQDLTELYHVHDVCEIAAFIQLINDFVHPCGQSLLLRLLKPLLILIFLAESSQGLKFLDRLGISVTSIPMSWTLILSGEYLNFWRVLNTNSNSIKLEFEEDDQFLRPLRDLETTVEGWSFSKDRLIANLERLAGASRGHLHRLYVDLIMELELLD